jgi:hypothetical protein
LLLKVAYQHDDRPAGEVQHANLVAAQLAYWF